MGLGNSNTLQEFPGFRPIILSAQDSSQTDVNRFISSSRFQTNNAKIEIHVCVYVVISVGCSGTC